ncbi:SNF2 family N-terminal domain-containing protein [Pelagophyceae sp. CCMP2097]|nr:SNF2 family N-terminal domain-containing protein [Pelagophyceae sp. CCMP2097]
MSGVKSAKTAYAFFAAEFAQDVRSKGAGDMAQRSKLLSETWRGLTDRSKFEALAAADKARFQKDSADRDAEMAQAQADARRKHSVADGDRSCKRAVDEEPPPRKKVVKRVESDETKAKKSKAKDFKDEIEANIAHDRADLKKRQADAATARLQFLLSQSDIFSHFGSGVVAAAQMRDEKRKKEAPSSPSRRRTRDASRESDDVQEEAPPKSEYLLAQPACIKGQMRPYQLEGLNWMIRLQENGMNGILADEMGLGKTLQSISVLGWLAEFKNVRGPHLVLVPKSTLGNWMIEFGKFCPFLRAVRFHGSKEDRQAFITETLKPGSRDREWDVVVTTYEVANAEKTALEKISWRYLMIDEAHRIKNEASLFARTARALNAERRLLITGTPLQNNLHELWALLNFLLPDVFASSSQFDEWFDLDVEDDSAKKQMIQQLHKLLRPFVLRRLKADVEKSLPPKSETILFTTLTKTQKEVYRGLLKRDIGSLLASNDDGGATSSASRGTISNIAMQLRKCCNHPYLFQGVEDRTQPALGEHLVQNCGKFVLLDKLLKRLKERGHRVLVFSQMTALLDVLEDFMNMRGYEYCRIDGGTSYEDRDELIEAYNRPGSSKFVFLLSTRAGGLGINLQTADTCILYDSDWNPQCDLQAMDRCHRIGQKKPVHVYRFVTANTIEEKIVERAQKKLKLDAMVVQQGRLSASGGAGGPSKDEMLEAVKFGASAIFRTDDDAAPTDEDIDAIINRGAEKTKELRDKLKESDQGDLLDFRLDGGVGVQQFEGIDYSEERRKKADADALLALMVAEDETKTRPRPAYTNAAQKFKGAVGAAASRLDKPANPVPSNRRMPTLSEWQFYDAPRLKEIEAAELAAFTALAGEALAEARARGALPAAVEAEKATLLAVGFDWSRTRFEYWLRYSSMYGRDDHAAIASHSKIPEAEVRRFAQTFWSRGSATLNDWDKLVKRIENGEKALSKGRDVILKTNELVSLYEADDADDADDADEREAAAPASKPKRRAALDIMCVDTGPVQGNQADCDRKWSRAEDRWLLCAADVLQRETGTIDGERLLVGVRHSPRFSFNAYLLSRTPQQLLQRAKELTKNADKLLNYHMEKLNKKRLKAEDSSAALEAKLRESDALIEAQLIVERAAQDKVSHSKSRKRVAEAASNGAAHAPKAKRPKVDDAVRMEASSAFGAYVQEKTQDVVVDEQHWSTPVIEDEADSVLGTLHGMWLNESNDVKRLYERTAAATRAAFAHEVST